MAFGRKKKHTTSEQDGHNDTNGHFDGTHDYAYPSKPQIKQATHTRFYTSLFTSLCLIITVVFMIIVEVGNTSTGHGLANIWFIRLNLSHVVPTSFADASLLNSIAQTLGLHDYYQVGLWNYCEGYINQGITSCTKPHTLYWFNPVQIITNQLIAGASSKSRVIAYFLISTNTPPVQLPSDLSDILNIIKVASQVMFGLFLAGTCLSFVLIFILWLSVTSRWTAVILGIISFINALCITAAAVIATVLFTIMKNVFASNTEVNIGAKIGTTMFACMWIASAFSIIAWVVQMALCCCCVSRRDLRLGTKKGRKAWPAKAKKLDGV